MWCRSPLRWKWSVDIRKFHEYGIHQISLHQKRSNTTSLTPQISLQCFVQIVGLSKPQLPNHRFEASAWAASSLYLALTVSTGARWSNPPPPEKRWWIGWQNSELDWFLNIFEREFWVCKKTLILYPQNNGASTIFGALPMWFPFWPPPAALWRYGYSTPSGWPEAVQNVVSHGCCTLRIDAFIASS